MHRDLKPLNVMLGEFGETLVLDWGLAKLFQLHEEPEVADPPDDPIVAPHSDSSVDAKTILIPLSSNSLDRENSSEELSGLISPVAGVTKVAAITKAGERRRSGELSPSSRRVVATGSRSATSHTVTGQILGTPAYMSPEQAQGLIDQLTARSDIYSLGGMLYKLLTNCTPITGKGAHELLRRVVAGAIKPPRKIDSSIPPPLEAICLKALSRRPADRYVSAVALASDVEAWLADEPVSVYSDPWYHRLRRWGKRHRTAVLSSSAALLVAIVGTGLWMTLEARRVDGLRRDTLARVDDARTAIERADLSKANTLLIEALGQVRAEAKLAQLRDRVQSDLDNIARLQAAAERERLAALSLKAERLFDQAQQASEVAKDFAQARTLLTKAVTLLANESSLAQSHRQAEQRLAQVNQTLARRSELDAATAQFEKFAAAVEDVRVFGGNVSGEDSVDDWKEARQRGQAALKLFDVDFAQPKHFDARLRLLGPDAIAQWTAGVLELLVTIAQAETNLAIKDQPDDVAAAAKRSLEWVHQAEAFRVASRPLVLLKANLLATLGQREAARQALAEAEQLPASTRLDHFWLAERARRRRQFATAIEHLHDALRVDPNDFWSLNLMGICHLNQGEPAAAAANFTACIARRPKLVWPYLSRALALADLEHFENAHRDLARAWELSPQKYAVLLNRGFVFLLQQNYAAAKADFLAAAELRPDLAAPHLNLAETSRRFAEELATSKAADGVIRAAAELQTALIELTQVLPIAPQQAAIYRVRGQVHVALSDPAAALADLQRSLRLEPNPTLRAVCWREIGLIHQRAKRYSDALSAFDQSLDQDPRDTHVIRQRAEVLVSLEKYDEAVAGFTAFLDKAGPVGQRR